MQAELSEVADNHHVRPLAVRLGIHVVLHLLERRDLETLAHVWLVQVHAQGLLLDESLSVRNAHVDEPTAGGPVLEMDRRSDLLHAEHVGA